MKYDYQEKKGNFFIEKSAINSSISDIDSQIKLKQDIQSQLEREITTIKERNTTLTPQPQVFANLIQLVQKQHILKKQQEQVAIDKVEIECEIKRMKKLQTRSSTQCQERSTSLERLTKERERIEKEYREVLNEENLKKIQKEEAERLDSFYSRESKRLNEKHSEIVKQDELLEEEIQNIEVELSQSQLENQTNVRAQASDQFEIIEKTAQLKIISANLFDLQSQKIEKLAQFAQLCENKLERNMHDIC